MKLRLILWVLIFNSCFSYGIIKRITSVSDTKETEVCRFNPRQWSYQNSTLILHAEFDFCNGEMIAKTYCFQDPFENSYEHKVLELKDTCELEKDKIFKKIPIIRSVLKSYFLVYDKELQKKYSPKYDYLDLQNSFLENLTSKRNEGNLIFSDYHFDPYYSKKSFEEKILKNFDRFSYFESDNQSILVYLGEELITEFFYAQEKRNFQWTGVNSANSKPIRKLNKIPFNSERIVEVNLNGGARPVFLTDFTPLFMNQNSKLREIELHTKEKKIYYPSRFLFNGGLVLLIPPALILDVLTFPFQMFGNFSKNLACAYYEGPNCKNPWYDP
ncbi:hypothetical protein LEP1GSC060_1777 [Leptospira weilii serovar Ranarum str. ICFT]|uniref:Uncharacterized protein n=1 Tax=Leptospira weilii serovar Ranarum str. ICFT TaxID=1218598 RepID=N1WQI6_9LEPT|nr:hypothetical protein [Leptospira weilii]EMY78078.1 hypothetical protein LEP1GSC060_1777 [Leptospira weilii serovar Ranarum str. ICFT]